MSKQQDQSWPLPRQNPDFQGHDAAEQMLVEAFDSGHLPHAWMICGPRGIGKATLAYRFARFVLSSGAGAAQMPQAGLFGGDIKNTSRMYVDTQHAVFKNIAAGSHPDFLSVERTMDEKKARRRSQIVVDDVRHISAFMSLTAAQGGWRVVIIDCVDDMHPVAANAVLKILEEPPARALLLLVCHNPGVILPTIRSRCRKLLLKPLNNDILDQLLAKHSRFTDKNDLNELVRLGDGSIGRALAMSAGGGGEGGLELYRDLVKLLETLPKLDVVALHRFGDRFAKKGAEDAFATISDLLGWWIGRLILFGATNGSMNAVNDGEKVLMQRLMQMADLDRWLEVWEKVNNLLTRAPKAYLDRKQVILNVFLFVQAAVRH